VKENQIRLTIKPIRIRSAILILTAIASFGQIHAQESTRLKPGDEIVITVFGQDDLNTNTQLSKSGQIEFSGIGSVELGGKTIAEATAEITRRLSGIYADPKVSITVTGYSADSATVAGQVRKPGPIELPAEGKLDLLAVIATAGGFSEQANPSRVAVRRVTEGESTVIRLDARRMAAEDTEKPFYIEPGDIITVAEQINEQVTVMGQVHHPGLVAIPAGETRDILSIIASAGAFLDSADTCRVQITRWTNGRKSVHQVNVEVLINDASSESFAVGSGDIVTVPALVPQRVTVMGQVNKPGLIILPPGGDFSLLDAIAMAGGYTEIANPKKVVVRRPVSGADDKLFKIDAKKMVTDGQAKSFTVLPNDTIIVAESLF
jgi:polysaccharide export outer membrane protein